PPEVAALKAARDVLGGIEEKRAAASARQTAIADERRTIAFAAHTGDAEAKRRLDNLNAESAALTAEMQDLDAVISEASRRVAAAEEACHQHPLRKRACAKNGALTDLRHWRAVLAMVKRYGDDAMLEASDARPSTPERRRLAGRHTWHAS